MRVAETAGGTCLCLHIDVSARVCVRARYAGHLSASIIRLSVHEPSPMAGEGAGESICARPSLRVRTCVCVCVCVMN